MMILISNYKVLVMTWFFPTDVETQQSTLTIVHISIVTLVNDLTDNFWFVGLFCIIFNIIDKRIAGIHVTLLASLTNMAQFSHKFYIFWVVEHFGIFIPQIIISIFGLLVCFYYKSIIHEMDNLPTKSWFVSDGIINSQK